MTLVREGSSEGWRRKLGIGVWAIGGISEEAQGGGDGSGGGGGGDGGSGGGDGSGSGG